MKEKNHHFYIDLIFMKYLGMIYKHISIAEMIAMFVCFDFSMFIYLNIRAKMFIIDDMNDILWIFNMISGC